MIFLKPMKYFKSVRNSRKNIDFEFFFRKISMFVKVFETVDLGKNFEQNIVFCEIFRISQFWSR